MEVHETNGSSDVGREAAQEQELVQIRAALRGLRFGSVNITIQDGVVVQIDRTEKRRIRGDRGPRRDAAST